MQNECSVHIIIMAANLLRGFDFRFYDFFWHISVQKCSLLLFRAVDRLKEINSLQNLL